MPSNCVNYGPGVGVTPSARCRRGLVVVYSRCKGRSGNTYFLTHFGNVRRDGRVYRFQSLGRVAEVPYRWWPAHIHEGKHTGVYKP